MSKNIIYKKVEINKNNNLIFLTLNRKEKLNALSIEMIDEFLIFIKKIKKIQHKVRAVILNSNSDNFCAGADVNYINDKLKFNKYIKKLSLLFKSFNKLNITKITVINGIAYGGALGLISICDIAIACENAKFCVSELKLGLIPALILPYVLKKVQLDKFIRLALTGIVFGADDAYDFGLIQKKVKHIDLESSVTEEINNILKSSPNAKSNFIKVINKIYKNKIENKYYLSLISKLQKNSQATKGIEAFLNKRPPDWIFKI